MKYATTTYWRWFSCDHVERRADAGSAGTIASIAKALSAISPASITVISRVPGRFTPSWARIRTSAPAGPWGPGVQQWLLLRDDLMTTMRLHRRTFVSSAGAACRIDDRCLLGRVMARRRAAAQDPAPAADRHAPSASQRLARARALMRSAGIGAVLVESGPSLDYFTGVQWWRSERLTGGVIPADGDPVIVTPFFERPSVAESLAVPAEIRTWNEHEEPLELVADWLRERASPRRRRRRGDQPLLHRRPFEVAAARVRDRNANPVVRALPDDQVARRAGADAGGERHHHRRDRATMPDARGHDRRPTSRACSKPAHGARGGTRPCGAGPARRGVGLSARIGQAAGCSARRSGADRHRLRGARLSVRHFAQLRLRRRRRRPSSARCGNRSRKASRSPSPRPSSACPRAASMTRCARPTRAGATARATSCPACRTAPATASAWKCMSRSISSTARRRRWRPACAFRTSRASTCPASSASGSRIAST